MSYCAIKVLYYYKGSFGGLLGRRGATADYVISTDNSHGFSQHWICLPGITGVTALRYPMVKCEDRLLRAKSS